MKSKKQSDSQPNAREALRLRTEGFSLRAIGERLGVDQKQVQRWLKAAGGATTPTTVTGLDGRRVRAKRGPVKAYLLHRIDVIDFIDLYLALTKLRRVTMANLNTARKAAKQGLTDTEVDAALQTATTQALVEVKLHTGQEGLDKDGFPPDEALVNVIWSILEFLTKEGVARLLELAFRTPRARSKTSTQPIAETEL